MKIVIVTACPSGIANSIIAAGLLEKASAELGWSAEQIDALQAPQAI